MEIKRRKFDYVEHLRWMLRQRKCMERIVQMSIAGNKEVLVENGDKCGDECLFIAPRSPTEETRQRGGPVLRSKSSKETGEKTVSSSLRALL